MFYPCISFLEGYIIHRMKRKTPTRYGRLIKNLRVEFHIRFCGTWIPPVSGLNSVMEPLFFLKHLFRNFPGRDQHICRTANAVGKHTQSAYPPKYTSCQRIFCSAFLLGVFRFLNIHFFSSGGIPGGGIDKILLFFSRVKHWHQLLFPHAADISS